MEDRLEEKTRKPWWKNLAEDLLSQIKADRRVFERFKAQFPLRIWDLQLARQSSGQVIDISAKGLGMVTREPLRPDAPIDMWLEIPDEHDPLYMRGRVVWQEPQDEGQYRVGICLDKVNFMGLGRALRAQ
jgi:hypothetical protein